MARYLIACIALVVMIAGGLSLWRTWWLSSGVDAFCAQLASEWDESAPPQPSDVYERAKPFVDGRLQRLGWLSIMQVVSGAMLAVVTVCRWRGRPGR